MKTEIIGKNLEITNAMTASVERYTKGLEKYFTEDAKIIVTLSKVGKKFKAELMTRYQKQLMRVEKTNEDMYDGVSDAFATLDNKISRYHDKLVKKRNARDTVRIDHSCIEDLTDEILIAKRKEITKLETITAEEACVAMDMSEHDFYMFKNKQTGLIAVVYRREGDTYGLIEIL